jgi:epoxyqueuosine reductase
MLHALKARRETVTTMIAEKETAARSRREFFRQAGCLGAMMCLDPGGFFMPRKSNPAAEAETDPGFRCRSVSLGHVAELREWMDKLDKEGRLSADKTWRRYVNSFHYAPTLAAARSLIVMATPLKIATIAFHIAGKKHTVMIPAGYVDDGMRLADYQELLFRNGAVEKGRKLERAKLPLKQLAVRSGLAEYGRNNITFIDGYGSFHQLLAFYTDQPLEDHWGRLKLMRLCKGCSICLKECPTGAIRANDFVIDPARCLTLYNELPDPMPSWIPTAAHNALIGCLKCQDTCPGNEDVLQERWDLGEVPEAETAALLSGRIDARTGAALKTRFRRIGGGDDLAYIARNLKLVLGAEAGGSRPRNRP